ncbi:MAG: hypothetical protein ABSE73_16185 [Planctomycetota bacterium]
MDLVNPKSLSGTLNSIRLARLRGDAIPKEAREKAASWIASRMSAPGSYRGLPAPTSSDYHAKLRLFTGETVGSHAGTGCKLGFEAAWALSVLQPTDPQTADAAAICRRRVIERYAQEQARRQGMYCCYSCSVAGWPALHAAGGGEAARLLGAAMALLLADRSGPARWARFPFWYTVLALAEMPLPAAVEELRYAASALESALRPSKKRDTFVLRRRLLARHVLGKL